MLPTNCWPVIVLTNLSKIVYLKSEFQTCLYLKSEFQFHFQKGFNSQPCLVAMIEKFRNSLDQGNEYALLFVDLSKAFDCLPHDLTIAKLHVYGCDMPSTRLMQSYLTYRYQGVKVNNS